VNALTIGEFFEHALRAGMDADPRGRAAAERDLTEARKAQEKTQPGDAGAFDRDKLTNPYADSRILHGDPDRPLRKILAGIDIETPELLLADRLNEKGAGIDLVLAHHPEGRAYANFYEVMKMQADILHRFGVPITVAESQIADRMREVERSVLPANHRRPVDAARLLDLPFACLHSPADNMVQGFIQSLFDRAQPEKLRDLLALLRAIPEYQEAERQNAGPRILVGAEEHRCGKIFVKMTGGTSGSKDTIERMSQAGIGTMVCMHLPDDHRKEAEKHHLRVVIAGHISSDTLGLNLLLDAVQKQQSFEVLECSGFTRVKRG